MKRILNIVIAIALLIGLIMVPAASVNADSARDDNAECRHIHPYCREYNDNKWVVKDIGIGKVNRDKVNLRTQPYVGKDNSLGWLMEGDIISIIGQSGNWYRVQFFGALQGECGLYTLHDGYVHKYYIRIPYAQ